MARSVSIKVRRPPGRIARRAARRLGIMPQARHVATTVRKLVGSAKTKRNIRDEEHLSLLLSFLLSRDASCIDIGANLGDILREILRVAPNGTHIAYEPLHDYCERLKQEFPTVDVRGCALSNRVGEAQFQHVRSLPGQSGFRQRDYPGGQEIETITVKVNSLDSSLPDGYVPSLIKIDVEGAEREVLEGAMHTITTARPIIVFEHERGAAAHYGTRPSDIYHLLCEQAKMRIFDLDGNGPYSCGQLEHVFKQGTYFNFIALP